jgi:uracil-DNA glycosylase family 4
MGARGARDTRLRCFCQNDAMTPAKRKQVLKALELESWMKRGAQPPAEPLESSKQPTQSVASAPVMEEKRGRGRPRLNPQPVTADVSVAAKPLQPRAVAIPRSDYVAPPDWEGLRTAVKDCTHCKLCSTRTQTVFGVGVENASLMVVGEGPGADEDAQGEPFVGRAGKLLDEMLKAIGRSRKDNVFIANVVKCRPPGNRDPEADEAEACRPYLERQIQLVQPKLIVALGRIAAQRLLQTDEPLSRLRGPIHTYGPDNTPLFITYHPAYLLRSPREKAKSWDDLKKISRYLKEGA